ncbi:hypothetical protein DUI87_10991 [Hirundo rustica rustica]|uniref:Uncharacterized protein n=1 Tax=Hirundo rustica rustica TaxID=333673 RepID=A0A3M0KK43_HIRRU|nr:hypothetical protein DUI87_10991 [Hirundo rustica rustica]
MLIEWKLKGISDEEQATDVALERERLGDEQIESSPDGKDLGVLMDERLSMKWSYALIAQKSNCILGCIKSRAANRVREVVLPLCSALLRPHLQCCIQLRGPQHGKDMDPLE